MSFLRVYWQPYPLSSRWAGDGGAMAKARCELWLPLCSVAFLDPTGRVKASKAKTLKVGSEMARSGYVCISIPALSTGHLNPESEKVIATGSTSAPAQAYIAYGCSDRARDLDCPWCTTCKCQQRLPTCSDSTLYLIAYLSPKPCQSLPWYGTALQGRRSLWGHRLCYSGHRDLGCFSCAVPKAPAMAAPSFRCQFRHEPPVSQLSSQAGLNNLWLAVYGMSHEKPPATHTIFNPPSLSCFGNNKKTCDVLFHKQSLGASHSPPVNLSCPNQPRFHLPQSDPRPGTATWL